MIAVIEKIDAKMYWSNNNNWTDNLQLSKQFETALDCNDYINENLPEQGQIITFNEFMDYVIIDTEKDITVHYREQIEYREFMYWNDLNEEQKKEFDYLETEEEQEQANFMKWINRDGGIDIYCTDTFIRTEQSTYFHGIYGISYFTCMLVRLSECGSCYKLAYSYQ